MTRRGVSLLEAVVAVAVLAVAVVGLVQLTAEDRRGLAVSEERLLAGHLVQELQETFGGRSLDFYDEFPAAAEGYPALLDSLLLAPETVFDPRVAAATDPMARALAARCMARGYRRMILFEPLPADGAVAYGRVRYVVRWRRATGGEAEASAFEIVSGPAGTP